ncbi:MAG TPA: hypothetical protein VNS32_25930 [Flavisolibacter sp.]|nr:hypothetical protein [Flavisolibacter sp.]
MGTLNEGIKKSPECSSLPVIKGINEQTVLDNYLQIKKEVTSLVQSEIERMMNTPELEGLIVSR